MNAVAGAAGVRSAVPMLEFEQAARKRDVTRLRVELHGLILRGVEQPTGRLLFYGDLPDGLSGDGRRWRLQGVSDGQVSLSSGGDVVGVIPEGLPSLEFPVVHWDLGLAWGEAAGDLPTALVPGSG